jgi:hypothetical protein
MGASVRPAAREAGLFVQPEDDVADLVRNVCLNSLGWLVENQERWLEHQRPANGELLLFVLEPHCAMRRESPGASDARELAARIESIVRRPSEHEHSRNLSTPDRRDDAFFIFGEGNQSLDDESWAMDNLRVSVTTLQPTAVVLLRVASEPEPAPCST